MDSTIRQAVPEHDGVLSSGPVSHNTNTTRELPADRGPGTSTRRFECRAGHPPRPARPSGGPGRATPRPACPGGRQASPEYSSRGGRWLRVRIEPQNTLSFYRYIHNSYSTCVGDTRREFGHRGSGWVGQGSVSGRSVSPTTVSPLYHQYITTASPLHHSDIFCT